MPYDPLMHVAHVNNVLDSSTITDGWNQRGQIYIRDFERRLDEATLEIQRTLAETVNDASAHHSLGFQYMEKKRYDEAIAEYQKALLLNPKNRNTAFNIGACYEYKKQYPQALEYYELAGKHNPKDADSPYRLSRTYFKMGKYELAMASIDAALKMNQNEKYYLLRGNILEALGHKDEAVKAYWKALEQDPGNSYAEAALNHNLAKW
jgi:tetratricopeptide (TPR) repeat protein